MSAGIRLSVIVFFIVQSINTTSPAFAGDVAVQSMQFGSIAPHPGGDTIIIDASSGATTPVASYSPLEGGRSGRLRLTTTADQETVQIDYPSTATLSCNSCSQTLTIKNIATRSQYSSSVFTITKNDTIDVAVGGDLVLSGSIVPGTYSGSILIDVIFQ